MSTAEQIVMRLTHNEKIELHNLLDRELNGHKATKISILQMLLDNGYSKLIAKDKILGMNNHYLAMKYNVSDEIIESILKIEKAMIENGIPNNA